MRIVGKTDKGYLCQINIPEMGCIMGFGRYPEYGSEADKLAFNKAIGKSDRYNDIPTNTDIQILEGFMYLEQVREKTKTAKSTAKALRELAEMLENPIPATIAPPEEVA